MKISFNSSRKIFTSKLSEIAIHIKMIITSIFYGKYDKFNNKQLVRECQRKCQIVQ